MIVNDVMDGRRVARARYESQTFQTLDQYADLLAHQGTAWGLIGPREIPRIWNRHLLNCAAVVDLGEGLVPEGAQIVDVGTGAGLPGLVWLIVRPDLMVTLVEPLARRVTFLELAVAQLGLADRAAVVRSRAEDFPVREKADIVTARAVAPLTKLLPWLLPLTASGGSVLALKGTSAEAELMDAREQLATVGPARVVTCGDGWLDQPTTVVVVENARGNGATEGGR